MPRIQNIFDNFNKYFFLLFKTICRQIIKGGLLYDYKMEIKYSYMSKQFAFHLETITTEACRSHKPELLYGTIPMNVFNWLKEQFAQLLER